LGVQGSNVETKRYFKFFEGLLKAVAL
jgi:hypothetical protein